jgi:methionine-gamma-lyase
MDRHCQSAQTVAEFIAAHPAARGALPGLPSFPQHALAKADAPDGRHDRL